MMHTKMKYFRHSKCCYERLYNPQFILCFYLFIYMMSDINKFSVNFHMTCLYLAFIDQHGCCYVCLCVCACALIAATIFGE